MRWVGRNIVDYMKLLDADVTRGFGGGVLVCMQDRVAQVTHTPPDLEELFEDACNY